MPAQIEWRRVPDQQHTGSAELRGVAGSPFLFVHPQDESGQPRSSPCALWTFNQADAANNNVLSPIFRIRLHGFVSYRSYQLHRAAYQNIAPADRADPWQGQDEAEEVWIDSPLATGLQPSGQCAYHAFISLQPPAPQPVSVTLAASLQIYSLGIGSLGAVIGMGRSVDAKAEILNHAGSVYSINHLARVRFPFQFKYRAHGQTYTVIIPPGGEVQIGKVMVGLAYEIRRGSSRFLTSARIAFQIGATQPIEIPNSETGD